MILILWLSLFSVYAKENLAEVHFKKDMRCGKSKFSYSGPQPNFREPGRILKGDRYSIIGYDAGGKDLFKMKSDLYYMTVEEEFSTISNEGRFEEGKDLEGHLSFLLRDTRNLKKVKLFDSEKMVAELDIVPTEASSTEWGNGFKCYWNQLTK